MGRLLKFASIFAISMGAALAQPAAASTSSEMMFAVMRNDDRIGTNTIKTEDVGKETVVETVTHVAVKLFFVTVYRFDQTETEHWSNGHFLAMSSITNDNGKLHKASAASAGDGVIVEGDGFRNTITSPIFPGSLWNPAVLAQSQVLNPSDGHVMAMKISDRGDDNVNLDGRQVRARHYVITSNFSQDAWYDAQHQLLKVQMRAPDGSTIQYLRL